jgi:hypothetical protein
MVMRQLSLSGTLLAVMAITPCHAADPPDPDAQFLAARYARVPAADFAGSPQQADVATTEAQLSAGLLQAQRDAGELKFGFDYQYTRYTYSGVAGRDRDLHRVQLPVRFSWQRSRLRLDGLFAAGVSTSSNVIKDPFNEMSADDVQITAGVAMRGGDPQRQWIAGAAYSAAFGRPRAYPVIGMELMLRDRVWTRVAFPDSALSVALTPRQTLTARLFPAGHQWHVVSDQLGDDFDYRFQALRGQVSWSYRGWSRLTLDLSLGYETGRHHLFVDDSGARVDLDADNQLLLAVGFRVGVAPLPRTHSNHF